MRQVIAGICTRHGFYRGGGCTECTTGLSSYFNTGRDKLWEFVDINTTGKPIQFLSKRKWREHLKTLNMTDDVPHWQNIQKPKSTPTPRNEIKDLIRAEMKERNIYDTSKLFRRK